MTNKKILFRIVLGALILVVSVVLSLVLIDKTFVHPKSVIFLQGPAEITGIVSCPGNNRQREASVWLGCYDKQIYYYGGRKNGADRTKYDNSLYVFQEDGLAEVFPLSCGRQDILILGIMDCFLYYRDYSSRDYKNLQLYCYNLESNKESLLYSGPLCSLSSLYFANDGSVYFPLFPKSGEAAQFVHVSGESVLGVKPLTDGYPLGENTYYVVSEYQDIPVGRILKTDHDGNDLDEIPFETADRRWIIPYDDGLLVHNEGRNSLLYRINEDGSVTTLFTVPCLASTSAVNIHGTDAYISILRYEEYGEKGKLRYENDLLSGTYRISLIDGSTEKISDMYFNGLYNFDDTCFYCCDELGNIYKMEFDGTTVPILLLSED